MLQISSIKTIKNLNIKERLIEAVHSVNFKLPLQTV